MTEVLLTVDRAEKTMEIEGRLASGETPSVTVDLGIENLVSTTGLRLRVRFNNADVAVFPASVNDAWDETEAAEGRYKCALNLNTAEIFRAFSGASDRAQLPFLIIVDYVADGDSPERSFYAEGVARLKKWIPQVAPTPLDMAVWQEQLANDIAANAAAIEELRDAGNGVSTSISSLVFSMNGLAARMASAEQDIVSLDNRLAILDHRVDHKAEAFRVDTLYGELEATQRVVAGKASFQQLQSHTLNSGIHLNSDEKAKLAGISVGAQVNAIETVKVDGVAQPVSQKTVNIDLSGKVNKAGLSPIARLTTRATQKKIREKLNEVIDAWNGARE